jgi:hypothetical protein
VITWTLPPPGVDPWYPWRLQKRCEECPPDCAVCLAARERGELVIIQTAEGRLLCLAHLALR